MRILAIGLAAFRLSSLLSAEAGPYRLAERLRDRFPDKQAVILTGASGYREKTEIDDADEGVLLELEGFAAEVGRVLRCSYCSSIWLAAAFGLLDRRAPWVVDAFAAAGLVAAWLDNQHIRLDAIAVTEALIPGGDPADAAD